MNKAFIAIALLVAALLLAVLLRPAGTALPFTTPATDGGAQAGAGAPAPGDFGPRAARKAGDEVPGEEEFTFDEEAIASLRAARDGDPRTPPIGRSEPQEQATAEELADPARYAEYEARQERKLKAAYVVEAEKYVARLRADIERGKAMGIPPDEIAKVERKVRGIEEMRAKLLAENPGLLPSADSKDDGSARDGSRP